MVMEPAVDSAKENMMWIRYTYNELENYLMDKYQNVLQTRDARSCVDRLLKRMYTMCTGDDHVTTGNDLQSKWRKWAACHGLGAGHGYHGGVVDGR